MLTLATIRSAAIGIAVFIGLAIFTALVSANVRRLVAEKGWDAFFLRAWNAAPAGARNMLSKWRPLRELWWLWLCFGLSSGLGIALWLLAPAEMAPSTVIPPTAIQNPQVSIQSPSTMTPAPQPTESAIGSTYTKKDISRLLSELPELYELTNVAKNHLLPQIQVLVNNSFLANGGSIQSGIEKANATENDLIEFEKNVDSITNDKYFSNILLGLIDGKDILHTL